LRELERLNKSVANKLIDLSNLIGTYLYNKASVLLNGNICHAADDGSSTSLTTTAEDFAFTLAAVQSIVGSTLVKKEAARDPGLSSAVQSFHQVTFPDLERNKDAFRHKLLSDPAVKGLTAGAEESLAKRLRSGEAGLRQDLHDNLDALLDDLVAFTINEAPSRNGYKAQLRRMKGNPSLRQHATECERLLAIDPELQQGLAAFEQAMMQAGGLQHMQAQFDRIERDVEAGLLALSMCAPRLSILQSAFVPQQVALDTCDMATGHSG
jgi:hypothetical protein